MGVHSNGFIGKHVTSSGYRNATSSSGTGVSDCTEALKRDPKCIINDHMHHVTLLQVLWLVRGLPHARTVNTAGMRRRTTPRRSCVEVNAWMTTRKPLSARGRCNGLIDIPCSCLYFRRASNCPRKNGSGHAELYEKVDFVCTNDTGRRAPHRPI